MTAIIEHASGRILGATAHPIAGWVTQAARSVVMDIEDAGCRVKYLIRDRVGKYSAGFDQILADAGIAVARSGVQMARRERDHGSVGAGLPPWASAACCTSSSMPSDQLGWNSRQAQRR